MQHLYSHDETEIYPVSTQMHTLYQNVQYQQENRSLSPQQSSASEPDETSTTPPSSSSSTTTASHRPNVSATNKIVKKKKQPKKKRKDPNEPQKPVSPYALFFRDTQNDIKKKLANPSFGEISKVVAHMWENIEPEVKEQYKRKAATAKKEYLKQLAAYRAVQVSHQTPNIHHLLGNNNNLQYDPNGTQMSIGHQQKPYHSTTLQGSMVTENNNLLSSSHHHYQSYHHHHHLHHHPHPSHASQAQQQHTGNNIQQYCTQSSSIQSANNQFNNYHYVNNYVQEPSINYENNPMHFSNHYDGHGTYSNYDSNNNNHQFIENNPHQQHYGLLRPAIDSEIYSSYYNPSNNDLDSTSTPISSTANENLLHNLNHSMINHPIHYTDLSSGMSTTNNNGLMEKHYDYINGNTTTHSTVPQVTSTSSTANMTTVGTLNDIDHNQKDDDRSTLSISNENNFHWNQTCLATQW